MSFPKPAVGGFNSNETEISRILKQISESTPVREKKPRRSYSFLINKHLKRLDSDSTLKNHTTHIPGSLSVDNNTHALSPSDRINDKTNHSYLFNRRSNAYASFANRNFIKAKSSLKNYYFLQSLFFLVESKLIKFRKVFFQSLFLRNRSQVSASRGHKVFRAASGHPDSNPLRASGLFQEACRSRASILQGLGQTHQKRAVKA